jgi:acetyl-CoA carboxylase biotin carboxyl carrier protein
MTIDEIRELIQVVQDTSIAELEVQRGENRVRIRRSVPGPSPQDMLMPTVLPVPVAPAATPAPAVLPPPHPAADLKATTPPGAKEDEQEIVVKSPIVGTYYDSPSPGAPPFVKVGDHVEPKQVLCIIESMKLMNEIEAEVSGTISRKLVENGRPVEYGETLFFVRPH